MSERLELYKLMVSTITTSEQRRQQVSTVNTSLLVAGMAALGGIKGIDPIYVALPALPLSLVWLLNILYYRRIAEAKWQIIASLEQQFESQPFSDEWKVLKSSTKWLRFELTHLEMAIPIAIVAASTIYISIRVWSYSILALS